jgi:hypothetical protein
LRIRLEYDAAGGHEGVHAVHRDRRFKIVIGDVVDWHRQPRQAGLLRKQRDRKQRDRKQRDYEGIQDFLTGRVD